MFGRATREPGAGAGCVGLVLLLGLAALLQPPVPWAEVQAGGFLQLPADSPPPPEPAKASPRVVQKVSQAGITVEFALEPVVPTAKALQEGDEARLQFHIRDASGYPLAGAYPVAWMDARPIGLLANTERCRDKVQAFLQASLAARPTIDLNTYYIVVLNRDPTLSVVDPQVGFGTSHLYGMVTLESAGADWVLTQDNLRLFVSLPEANKVAVVDTVQWRVAASLEAGDKPRRVALQPDERYLWVGNDGDAGGVTVLDARELKPVTHIATGAGPHDIAFTEDNRFALVSHRDSGTLSIIDIRELAPVAELETGSRPVGLAYSPRSGAAYVIHEGDGAIAVVDVEKRAVAARMEAQPGLKAIAFEPTGRWGFVTNSAEGLVHAIDTSSNRIVHTLSFGAEPDQISFTDNYAYIRLGGSEEVQMIRLSTLGGTEVPAFVDFPGGQAPPSKVDTGVLAGTIVAAPEGEASYVANPGDKMIYYYHEGMAAPKGGFQNYGHEPQAVLVVNRSLRETRPGSYATTVQLPAGGQYDVALFLDSPRLVHCFDVSVAPNPALRKAALPLVLQPFLPDRRIPVQESFSLRFKVTSPETHEPLANLADMGVLIFQAPGAWRQRAWATPLGEGLYEVSLKVPQPGVYYVFFECPSLHVQVNQLPHLILQAEKKDSPAAPPPADKQGDSP